MFKQRKVDAENVFVDCGWLFISDKHKSGREILFGPNENLEDVLKAIHEEIRNLKCMIGKINSELHPEDEKRRIKIFRKYFPKK